MGCQLNRTREGNPKTLSAALSRKTFKIKKREKKGERASVTPADPLLSNSITRIARTKFGVIACVTLDELPILQSLIPGHLASVRRERISEQSTFANMLAALTHAYVASAFFSTTNVMSGKIEPNFA